MESQKKMLFIFNPTTGGGRLKNSLMEIVCRLSEAGYDLHVCPTHAQGDARRFARERGGEHDIVVCCGGDGTLNEVLDGLKDLPQVPQLGYIPGGTTCDFASSLNIPKGNMLEATGRITAAEQSFACDLGLLNGRAFVYVAAFGAFTNVAYNTPQKQKNLLGYFAYLLEGVQQLPKLESAHAHIVCDGQEEEDEYLLGMITNSTSVGGFSFPNSQEIQMDDGEYEVILVKQPHNLGDLGELSAAVLGGSYQSHLLTILRGSQMEFQFDEPVDWTVDGEFGGSHEKAGIKIRQRAFNIYV